MRCLIKWLILGGEWIWSDNDDCHEDADDEEDEIWRG